MTDYQQKKNFYAQMLTIYGRKPVLEALQDKQLTTFRLHLAESNKSGGIINDIISLAEQRKIDIQYHDKKALSRISRNGKQDQGVAADIKLQGYQSLDTFIENMQQRPTRLIALDSITNPQNLGMIIRSVCAGYIDGLLIPKNGCAPLSPLVIKASAGTLFKATIIHCDSLAEGLSALQKTGYTVCTLSSHAPTSLFDYQPDGSLVYVLGNETEGVSAAVADVADQQLAIPMNNQVESLNVAVTAALIAFTRAPLNNS